MHRRIGKIKSMHLAVTKNTGNPNKAVIQSQKKTAKNKNAKKKTITKKCN